VFSGHLGWSAVIIAVEEVTADAHAALDHAEERRRGCRGVRDGLPAGGHLAAHRAPVLPPVAGRLAAGQGRAGPARRLAGGRAVQADVLDAVGVGRAGLAVRVREDQPARGYHARLPADDAAHHVPDLDGAGGGAADRRGRREAAAARPDRGREHPLTPSLLPGGATVSTGLISKPFG